MIVYREQRRRVRTADVPGRIANATGLERLIEEGELAAGVADAFCPDRDDEFDARALPEEIEISVPEGFAYYALDPELYRMAARRFAADARPESVAVIGIRSIGAPLASVVEGELRGLGIRAESWTVRPRGHPWNRELRVGPRLERRWREFAGCFAIVDEGPGLSGTSFCSVAEYLSRIGIPDSRIAFFPSWDAEGANFVSESARRRWPRHRRYTAAFEELHLLDDARDLSAGRWREIRKVWPAVQPQHERRKYLREGRLYKFAGYGRYGRAALERANRLAPFTTAPAGLENGFLVVPWLEGAPVRLCAGFIEFTARYFAFLRREFSLGHAADTRSLAEMIEVNTGRPWDGPIPEGEAVALDGRVLPHEWLETPDGYVKLDGLDHHDDHFFPGPQDIAWDLAAFDIEFGGGEYLMERYRRESGDQTIGTRLPFYRAAYLAFRLGYTDLAARSLGASDDAARFRRDRTGYAAGIRSLEHVRGALALQGA
jgi:hypothetical protein